MARRRKEMPERWAKFCVYYLEEFNAADAARRAGYNHKQPELYGMRLLRKEPIKAYISAEIESTLGAARATLKKRILDELDKEAFGEGVFTDETKGGTVTRANPNKMKALEMLAKHLAMLTDNVKVSGGLDLNLSGSQAKEFIEAHGLAKRT